MPKIDREQLRAFAEDGYVVLPQIVSPDLLQAARRAVANRVEQDPPRAGHRGPHSYFLVDDLPQALMAPQRGRSCRTRFWSSNLYERLP